LLKKKGEVVSNEVTDENGKFLWYKYASTKVLLPAFGMVLWGLLIYLDKLDSLEKMFGVGLGLLLFCGLLTASDAVQLLGRKKEDS
jgi:hypothetical protein